MRLRPWTSGDADTILEAFAATDMDGQRDGPIESIEDAGRWIEASLAHGTHTFALDVGGTAVGSVSVSAIDAVHETGWVSYWTVEGHRGRGYASAGLALLSEWCFEELGLFRLELGHRVNNPASCRVATAAGFAIEGLERAKLKYGNERFDVELHARLRPD